MSKTLPLHLGARRRFLCLVGLAACGGGGIPGNAVVQVGGNPITKATFEHWLSVAAASSSTTAPGQTAPKPVVPDPPELHGVHRPPGSDRAETGQRPGQADRPRS